MRRCPALSLIPALTIILAGVHTHAQTHRSLIASGAVDAENSTLRLTASLGQPIIGITATLHGTARQGFWYPQSNTNASVNRDEDMVTLLSCSPNPITASGTITLRVPVGGTVVLTLHDLLGRTVQRLVDARHQSGELSVELDAEGLPEGRYTLRLTHSRGESSLPVLVVR